MEIDAHPTLDFRMLTKNKAQFKDSKGILYQINFVSDTDCEKIQHIIGFDTYSLVEDSFSKETNKTVYFMFMCDSILPNKHVKFKRLFYL